MKPGLYGAIFLGTSVMAAVAIAVPVSPVSTIETWTLESIAGDADPSQPEFATLLAAPGIAPALPEDLSHRFAQAAYVPIPEMQKDSAGEHFSQVPEPGSYGLFGTGLLGLAFIRHRRNL